MQAIRTIARRGLSRGAAMLAAALVVAAGAYAFIDKGYGLSSGGPVGSASKADFFVFLGQSNMDNAWGIPARFTTPNPNVKIWRSGKWEAYKPGGNASNQRALIWGPEIEFLYQWAQSHPGKTAYVVKQATGGTSLAVDWKQDGTGRQWNEFVSQYKAAKGSGVVLPTPTVLIMHGEADSYSRDLAKTYQANFQTWFASIRSLLGPSRIIVGRVDTEIANRGYLGAKAVQKAQTNVVAADGNAAIFSTDAVELDPPPSPHFTKPVGIPHLGLLFYKSYAGAYADAAAAH